MSMEALLPMLQMRALQGHLLQEERRQSLSSTGESPPTPLSPSAGPYDPPVPLDMKEPWGQGQLYLNQLAAINLHIQQKRLLSSTSEDATEKAFSFTFPPTGQQGRSREQDEPMDADDGEQRLSQQRMQPIRI